MDHVLTALTGSPTWAGARRARWWTRMRGRIPHSAAPLLEVVGACRSGVPDFLVTHPQGTDRQLADELDALVATTAAELRQALAGYGAGRGVPRIVVELRDGDTRRLRLLAGGALALFRACLAEDWSDIQRHLRTDIAHRAHVSGEAGIGAMLGVLHHRVGWQEEGVLRCAVGGPDRTVDLDGRGLELHPNFFVQDGVGAVLVPGRPAVLLHPAVGPSAERERTGADPLTGLIGPARARVLRAVGQAPCSTTELAARLGIGLSTASAHATALRTTGAITTQRQGRHVRHLVAPLGRALLSAGT
ncbi:ArsR/SmtB family transcription factor [Kitasatospora sp. NPDC089913]|uniref:winged helix-turn-helix domain-containing protein n=1 Tax=Streptomycetaceae TaxID=2062 RepID=UPI0013520F02|nr:winged helix-turn-helix domain-containing protein [Streptomyces sp. TLI_053]